MKQQVIAADTPNLFSEEIPSASHTTIDALQHHINHALLELENAHNNQNDLDSLMSIAFSLQCIRRVLIEHKWIEEVRKLSPWLSALGDFEQDPHNESFAKALWNTVGTLGALKCAMIDLGYRSAPPAP